MVDKQTYESVLEEISKKETAVSDSERIIKSHKEKAAKLRKEIAELKKLAETLHLQERLGRMVETANVNIQDMTDADFNSFLAGIAQVKTASPENEPPEAAHPIAEESSESLASGKSSAYDG